MLERSPVAGRRGIWITLAGLAVAGVVGSVLVAVTRDDPPANTTDPTSPVSVAASASRAPRAASSRPGPPGVAPDDSRLVGGLTNHLEFARRLTVALLAYDADTDFAARNADLLLAAAPPPYGDPAGLAEDLTRFTPTGPALGLLRDAGTRVAVQVDAVTVSGWAARRLRAIGVSSGVHGVDVTATQVITSDGTPPVRVSVELGLTVACPPAVAFCTVERVHPQHLEHALGDR